MFDLATVGEATPFLHEHRDEPGCDLEKRLVGVRAQRRKCVEPLFRCALRIEQPFFLFGRYSDSRLGP